VDGESRAELDNFYECQVQMDGKIWRSSEHYYQAAKFPLKSQQREKIHMAPSGMESWKLGNSRSEEFRPDWEEVKVEMMYQSNLAKFSQNKHLRDVLVNSRGPITAQGDVGCWKTWNEVLLERIREELRDFEQQDCRVLRQRIAAMRAYQAAVRASDAYALKVAVHYASQRMPIPDTSQNSTKAILITGVGKDIDGTYRMDLLNPETNGQTHYSRREGGHFYVGHKKGRRAWVIDEDYSPAEATGQAFLSLHWASDGDVPLGQLKWQVFDDDMSQHCERMVTIEIQ
jgi:predicted NAD-dependent protein-ADP-ribosyltransferase YbiA (DUF1768 family)